MIAATQSLPIELADAEFEVSDEAVDLVAAMLLSAVDRQDREAAAENTERRRSCVPDNDHLEAGDRGGPAS